MELCVADSGYGDESPMTKDANSDKLTASPRKILNRMHLDIRTTASHWLITVGIAMAELVTHAEFL